MGESISFRLILASASPARRELLERFGFSFDVRPAHIDEPTQFDHPQTFVQSVAWLKAQAVADTVEEGVILAADTIGWIDGQAILKPEDREDAKRIFRQLGGRTHELWTGVCLWRQPDGVQLAWQERSDVAFAKLSEEEIEGYLASRSWKGHSGGYAIREEGDPHVTVERGSTTNVIGLPMESLRRYLPLLNPSP